MRNVEIWASKTCQYFAPQGGERGEEIFAAPLSATTAQIEYAWRGYELGIISWWDLATWDYWEEED